MHCMSQSQWNCPIFSLWYIAERVVRSVDYLNVLWQLDDDLLVFCFMVASVSSDCHSVYSLICNIQFDCIRCNFHLSKKYPFIQKTCPNKSTQNDCLPRNAIWPNYDRFPQLLPFSSSHRVQLQTGAEVLLWSRIAFVKHRNWSTIVHSSELMVEKYEPIFYLFGVIKIITMNIE